MRAVDRAQPAAHVGGMKRPRFHSGLPPDREPEMLEVIARLSAKLGHAPTLAEIGEEMNVSRQRVAKMVAIAEERGVVTRIPRQARTVKVAH